MIDARLRSAAAGLLAVATVLLALVLTPERLRTGLREGLFDLVLSMDPRAPSGNGPQIVIVDIDRQSLQEIGSWPWPRGVVARLIDALAAQGATAIAVDIIFAGADQRSPGSVARRLAEEAGDDAIREAARRLEDGDRRMAAAIEGRPVALALLLDPNGFPPEESAPVLLRGGPALPLIWSAAGVQPPLPELARAAAGLGVASIPGDADGVVRRIPLLARAGGRLVPGLAAEAARLAAESSGYLLSGPDATLTLGDAAVALPPDGMLRLSPRRHGREIITVPAGRLLAGEPASHPFKGAIALIGSSAPEAGGLRLSHLDPLVSSTRLQALALRQLLAGASPRRPSFAAMAEPALGALAGLVAIAIASRLRPRAAAAAAALLLLGIMLAAITLAARDILIDPSPALAASAAGFLATSLAAYSLTRRREAALRRRFEQHLAPDVVARIAASPDSLKLGGEKRRVTALFTDIEGFSALTARASPEELIALLDGYFEGVAAIVVDHGGMIDKFVGDAVHAIFNAPLDLTDHVDKAILCAMAIVRWSEAHRREERPGRLGLGRTRIGIEEGEVVVGDVGLSTKLDYTAHGPAMNLAARLEALNKELGTSICIGPSAAAATSLRLKQLGHAAIRGVGSLEVHTPDDV